MKGRNIVGGKEKPPISGKTFESRNPSQMKDIIGIFPESGREDLLSAIESAKEAFKKWAFTPAPVRGEVIGTFGKLLEKNKGILARLVTREMGKTLKESRGSVQEAIDTAHFFQTEGRRLYGMTVPSEMPRKELFTYRRPWGVVGMITPGNFPIAVSSWKIIPALLCGNTVVWKPSEDTPTASYLFGKLFEEAGLPAGVLNIVFGKGEGSTGEAMVDLLEEGHFQKFSFTGSTTVGRRIGEAAGKNLMAPALELGGKNPLVVMEDADVDLAVEGALWASYGTAGQRCTSCGNIILHRKIAKKFRDEFIRRARRIRIGDPNLDEKALYGPLINEKLFNRFLEHLDMGREDGARLLLSGERIRAKNKPSGFRGDPEGGFYVRPALWEDVSPGMKIFETEIFGPTVNLVVVKDFEEALFAASDSSYGLTSAIYTKNPLYMHEFRSRIKCGMVSINNSTTGAEAHLPFGGVGSSGNGTRESGVWVLDTYTWWQAANVDFAGRLQLAQMDTGYISPKPPTDFSKLLRRRYRFSV